MADPEYFTLAELRALPGMANTTTYPDARCLDSAAYITGVIEQGCRTSFVSRTVTETHDGGVGEIFLRNVYVRSVTSATENGATVTDTLRSTSAGVLTRYSGATSYIPKPWLPGCRNVSITYVTGYSATPPPDVKEAALFGTRDHLLATSSNAELAERQKEAVERAKVSNPGSCGYVDVDALILRWRGLVALGVS